MAGALEIRLGNAECNKCHSVIIVMSHIFTMTFTIIILTEYYNASIVQKKKTNSF